MGDSGGSDLWGQLFSSFAEGMGKGLGGGIAGGTSGQAAAIPSFSGADSVFGTSKQFDNAGWNVGFKNSGIKAATTKTSGQGSSVGSSTDQAEYVPYALGALVLLLLVRQFNRKR